MKKAFTLAEVLITIVIIGIIAAITAPIIITNYQKQTCVKKAKKSYSTFSQAINTAAIENGSPENWPYSSEDDFAQKYLLPYLQVLKQGKNSDFNYPIKNLGGKVISDSYTNLSNGMKIFLTDGSVIFLEKNKNQSMRVLIDGNGEKGPNSIGKDIFAYTFYDGKLNSVKIAIGFVNEVPDFIKEWAKQEEIRRLRTDNIYGCNKEANGYCCSTLLMENSWELPKDYPW